MTPPKWLRPVAIVALVWNLLGCAAFLSDLTLTPADVANMTPDQQALYAARPAWALAATGIAVWGGAAGCIGLVLLKRWSVPLLVASLAGVVVQDAALAGMTGALSTIGPATLVLQGVVLVVAIGLVLLARTASRRRWLFPPR